MQKICIVPKSTRCIRVPETVHEHLVSWLITSARLHLEQMQHHMHSLDRCRCWPLLHVTWSVCQLGTWVRCAKWMNRLWAHLGQIRVCCTGLTAPPLEGAFWGGDICQPIVNLPGAPQWTSAFAAEGSDKTWRCIPLPNYLLQNLSNFTIDSPDEDSLIRAFQHHYPEL